MGRLRDARGEEALALAAELIGILGELAEDGALTEALRGGASAGEGVVFEDALHCVETAKNAGFRTCAVFDSSALEKCSDGRSDWEHMEETADFVIKSWRDIL